MDAITEMRGIVKKSGIYQWYVSGVVTDIKNLAMAEMPIYVVVAAVLSLAHFVTNDGFPGNTSYLFAWYRYGDCL